MNILVVNWTWYPSGGDWTYVDNLVKLYEKKGHRVIPFSMKDDRNGPSEFSQYFIENINYRNIRRNITSGIKVVGKSIYSTEAERKLEQLLDDVQIDLAHLNVIHHYITPIILKVLKKRNIRILWTMNEYTPICPESTFVSHDEICERCYGGAFYNCITHTCKKGSVLASTVAATENYVHKYLNYYRFADHYICPSVFVYNKFKAFNFFPEKLAQIYYAFDYSLMDEIKASAKPSAEKYVVFVGRLEKIKGVMTVLKAMRLCPDIQIKIVGDGSQEDDLKAFASVNELTNITFTGKKNKRETLELINGSLFLICSSEWYEVLGFIVVEAMGLNKPVIGSAIGAIPEMVLDNETGWLYEPKNHAQLAEKIRSLYADQASIDRMGIKANKHIRQLVNSEKHFEGLKKLVPEL